MADTYESYLYMPKDKLEEIFHAGNCPDLSRMKGFEFRGYNIGWGASLLGIRKFFKVFSAKEDRGCILGYNLMAKQNKHGEAHVKSGYGLSTQGFYHACILGGRGQMLINYGLHKSNFKLDPARLLRDYVVEIGPDRYLGKAFLSFFGLNVLVSYFVLEKTEPIEMLPIKI